MQVFETRLISSSSYMIKPHYAVHVIVLNLFPHITETTKILYLSLSPIWISLTRSLPLWISYWRCDALHPRKRVNPIPTPPSIPPPRIYSAPVFFLFNFFHLLFLFSKTYFFLLIHLQFRWFILYTCLFLLFILW